MSVGLTPGRGIALAGLLVVTALLAPGVASAATVTPNTTTDEYSATNDGVCSLREAVQSTNTNTNFGGCTAADLPYNFITPDTIQLPTGHYTLSIVPTGGDDNTSGDLDTTDSTTFQADAGAPVTIDGNATDRVLFAGISGVTDTLNGITITNGLVNNPAMFSSTSGGGVFTSGGTILAVNNSTISGNSSDGFGAGLAVNGPTTITNSTISGNSSSEIGGAGLASTGMTTLDHVTISDNHFTSTSASASTFAGGWYAQTGPATLHNSIIAGNTSASPTPAPDCQVSGTTITSQGGNVIGSDTGCTYTPVGNDSVNDPNAATELTSLGPHGGTTATHALLPGAGNPAIGRGVATCQATDQRGEPRSGSPSSCDSGAFELDHTLTVNPPANGTVTGSGISCPGDCSQDFHIGTAVPLTATPASGFLFGGWSGDCSGSGACTPVMDVDRTVGAGFAAIPPTGTTPPPGKKCKHKRKRHAVTAKKCKKKRR